MNEVQHGAQVEVAYTLRANGPEGEELETCQEESPFVFRMGAEEALEAFEKALVGKRVGEPFELTIACDDAYGEETDEAVLSLPKETFMVDGKLDEEVMQAGEVVPLSDDEGNEIVGMVVEVKADAVLVDFNHPLAGLDLHFEGVVVGVSA
ncbi:MAG: FKBP-type peptidyl-prolyl cis-trans isomerase [Flavobacteriales bacterium]|jgi:FKBP-type peptidyl-prolyl cis-trans isomerase SlyD|nr:FKBP-type peptidyl-prolyl cis-trans isomerase [Flavobacteriales bacterium]